MTALDLDDVARCLAPACPRSPAYGRLCRVHGDQVGQWLAEILADWRELVAAGAGPDTRPPVERDAASGRQSTKVKNRGTPVNLDVVTLTDRRIAWLTDEDLDDVVDPVGRDATPRVLEVLAWWAGLVRDGRGLPYPTRTLAFAGGPACPGRCWHLECAAARAGVGVTVAAALTVESERKVIVEELRWCLRQPWAGDLWRSTRVLWAALKTARGSDEGRPVAVCRRLVLGATGFVDVCGGRVYSERGAGWCSRCAHTWSGRELLELTRRGVAA